ncbi:hypothetical protein [Streptomyces sp. BP-8]|uniref:Uncharacterized protein n=1 Tax=Streptomyces sirii TaxID=3127701 RepID=A0ABZ2QEM3_9ACTN
MMPGKTTRSLEQYRSKRHADRTPEPVGGTSPRAVKDVATDT